MNGEPLDVCHRESPFGVTLLDVHAPEKADVLEVRRSGSMEFKRCGCPRGPGREANMGTGRSAAF